MPIPHQSKIHVVLLVLRLDVGGMERYLANVANGFDRKSFRVSILCLDSAGAAESWITESDVKIIELGIKAGNNLRVVNLITQALDQVKPDIVHSHNWATLLESYLAVKRFGRAVHVHGERGTVLGTNSCGPIKRAMRAAVMRWICRRIAVTTNSHRVADRVSSITGIPPTQMSVIPNGVSPKHEPDEMQRMRVGVRDELGFGSEDFVIGTVARLCKVKNLGLAIRSLAEVQERTELNVHLLFVGDGPCLRELQSQADTVGVSDFVHFVGHRWDTWRFMAGMDVFVNCSNSEGMSQSMLEAMAAGLPIVATDVGDAARMLLTENPGGIVIAPDDCRSLTDALIKMSAPGTRQAFASAARACQRERYGIDTMIRGYERLYRELASSNR